MTEIDSGFGLCSMAVACSESNIFIFLCSSYLAYLPTTQSKKHTHTIYCMCMYFFFILKLKFGHPFIARSQPTFWTKFKRITPSSVLEMNMPTCASYRTVQIAIALFTFLEYLLDDFALTCVVTKKCIFYKFG